LDPALRPLFGIDIKDQAKKFIIMFTLIVDSMDDMDQFSRGLRNSGRLHAISYGVKPAHYETVGTALLITLSETLKEGFTPACKKVWTGLYQQLSQLIKDSLTQPERKF